MFVLFTTGAIIVVFIVIAFYTKIKKDRLLEHETRQRIMGHIRDHPGTYYSEIRKDLDLAHGVLTHHLNMLETQEMIFSKQDRQFRRFYVEGMHSKGPMVTGSQKIVLDAIRRNPGLSQSGIARMLGVSRMVVSYHVSSLEKLGLVDGIREGRESLIYPVSIDEGMGLESNVTGRMGDGQEPFQNVPEGPSTP